MSNIDITKIKLDIINCVLLGELEIISDAILGNAGKRASIENAIREKFIATIITNSGVDNF